MGTFERFAVGDVIGSPVRALAEADVEQIVSVGGYTHPLFTDPAYAAASRFGRRPVPGQGVLLVMGGLAEQTDVFDATTIGLVGLDDVRFLAPAFAGDTVRLRLEILAKEQPKPGRGLLVMAWRCARVDGTALVEATARMLFSL